MLAPGFHANFNESLPSLPHADGKDHQNGHHGVGRRGSSLGAKKKKGYEESSGVQASMRLVSMAYPNKHKMKVNEEIEQEFTVENNGQTSWPKDTYLVFSGSQNQLSVTEEVYLGNLAPQCKTDIKIPIKMPPFFPENQDRYVIEYEIRHSYQT